MIRRLLACTAITVMASTALGAEDYCFPSANPPGGKSPSEVKQYVTIIWDDNGYSGKKYTQYEAKPGAEYKNSSWVGGQINEGGWQGNKPNDLNLEEGDMGMSWGARTLAGIKVPEQGPWDPAVDYSTGTEVIYNDTIWKAKGWTTKGTTPKAVAEEDKDLPDWELKSKYPWEFISEVDKSLAFTNPDGSPVHFTFNVISGLFVPVWPKTWQARESKFGYWKNQGLIDYVDGYDPNNVHSKIAIAWGREQQILEAEGGKEFQGNYILESFKEAQDAGHEIGNHTIDHMESNSPLAAPSDAGPFPGTMGFFPADGEEGFGAWGGEGFDYSELDTMPWGEVVDEATTFGQKKGASAQFMGWKVKAGKYISKEAWKGAISLSEEQLDEYMGISVANKNCHAFRAPRLEVNSGLYYALDELGYQYDCGLEEGYEGHIDGSNYYWPYTTDNGAPNVTYQRSIGVNVSVDSMPTGLWQIPSNVFTVPEEHRQTAYNNHKSINAAAPDGGELESFEEWTQSGAKITGYDFNLYILWGLTKDAWLATMKHNTQLRLDGNKAPLHYGAHTDYYTPIYDNATLMGEFNRPSYGQVVDSGWNDWRDRISSMEEYVQWGITNDCHFVSGHELIEEMKKLQGKETFGQQSDLDVTWTFFKNDNLGSSTTKESCDGAIDATVTVDKASGDEYPYCGYSFYENAGYFKGLDHIEFEYKVTAPIQVRLTMSSGEPREVHIGHVKAGSYRNTGRIPVKAFHQSQYSDVKGFMKDPIKTEDITGIEIRVITAEEEKEDHQIAIKNFKLYKGGVSVIDNKMNSVKKMEINSFTKNALSLKVPTAGKYSINIVSANGRLVKSFSNEALTQGSNMLQLGNIATGVYFINIEAAGVKKSIKAVTL